MMFGNDFTQKMFHLLPLDKQREYLALADYLAESGKSLRIEAVIHDDYRLDVIIRISDKFELNSVSRHT